ncbi:hypothetical protein TcasGA2_TC001441 [Tribolium castaneum]|uniref:Uncharacterized protein n=1 Tax=Tribolium castaneum TaxID=7070 RepID=D7EIK3_TRICA|nr:PREDICTED: uncharacterized protein LOC107397809 [Tribolium castaneum]EFA12026.1 hypothetical protein TcasGA2_TC001441 [Tribolium castaneum]|eukprot:XP_015834840.1 PREDICTED: uncharacterized protein LOC107397809 [Tribolium castaneum]
MLRCAVFDVVCSRVSSTKTTFTSLQSGDLEGLNRNAWRLNSVAFSGRDWHKGWSEWDKAGWFGRVRERLQWLKIGQKRKKSIGLSISSGCYFIDIIQPFPPSALGRRYCESPVVAPVWAPLATSLLGKPVKAIETVSATVEVTNAELHHPLERRTIRP